jgi:hypothetical protein
LLVAAPFYHICREEGRVYVYQLHEQVRESLWPLSLWRLWLLTEVMRLDAPWPCLVAVGSHGEMLRVDECPLPISHWRAVVDNNVPHPFTKHRLSIVHDLTVTGGSCHSPITDKEAEAQYVSVMLFIFLASMWESQV